MRDLVYHDGNVGAEKPIVARPGPGPIRKEHKVVLSFDGSQTGLEPHQRPVAQIFGVGQVLAPHELPDLPDDVRETYSLKNGQFPGVYVVIEVRPRQVCRLSQNKGFIHRETIDLDDLGSGKETQ